MKVKTRFLLGLGIMMMLALLLISVGWYQLQNIKQLSRELEQRHDAFILAQDIQQSVKDVAISLRNIMFFTDEVEVAQEIAHILTFRDEVTVKLQKLDALSDSAEEKLLVRALHSVRNEYGDFMTETLGLFEAGDREKAAELIMQNGHAMQQDYFDVISNMTAKFKENMDASLSKMSNEFEQRMLLGTILTVLGILLAIAIVFGSVWSFANRLNRLSVMMRRVASGQESLQTRLEVRSDDEIDDVANSFNQMAASLEEQIRKEQALSLANQNEAWLKTHVAEITSRLNGVHEPATIAQAFLSATTPLLEACQAVLYYRDEEGTGFTRIASYAVNDEAANRRFEMGEGLVGQAALDQTAIALAEVPAHYLRIRSGLGESGPVRLYIWPVVNRGETLAVVEMAVFSELSDVQQSLVEAILRNLGIIFESANRRIRLSRLLEESQALAEELQVQSEELQAQQEELKATNEVLETQTQALRRSEEQLQQQQEELEQTNTELREKALLLEERNRELEKAYQAVDEARIELEAKAKQLELSNIYKSQFLANMSHELRTPLNSLLILSKLLADNAMRNLTDKQVEYARTIYSSGSDLLRIINDILDLAKVEAGKIDITFSHIQLTAIRDFITSNFQPLAAEKNIAFTVTLEENLPSTIYSDELKLQQILRNLLSNAFKFTKQGEVAVEIGSHRNALHQTSIYFAVRDTGIGIPKEKQEFIFEAFQQADGSTSRQYGGTGLGLSISRQFAALLNGQITVESEEGAGSTFTLWIAQDSAPITQDQLATLTEETRVLAETAATYAVADDYTVDPDIKRVLIMAADQTERNMLMELIADRDVILTAVSEVPEAITEWHQTRYDYVIMQLQAWDHSVMELLKALRHERTDDRVRIFLLINYVMSEKEEALLRPYADKIIMNDGYALQRLTEEIDFDLQASTAEYAAAHAFGEQAEHPRYDNLIGKNILIVDDDVRNVFALTNGLELHGMQVHFAENGALCLAFLDQSPPVDLILMDIMMPEMDGYDTMRAIRTRTEYEHLPIIALTAKAMKEDRELCIAAGASDYIVKPVQIEQLLSMIQVWLYPAEG